MTTYPMKIALLRNQARLRDEPFELTVDEFRNWKPGQVNKLALFKSGGHRHVWRIDPDKPWSVTNIEWRDELRELHPVAQIGRPRGRYGLVKRKRRTALEVDIAKQREAKARERVANMTEAQLQCIAGKFAADASNGVVMTKAQWIAELKAKASEKQPKSDQIQAGK